ncbi:hypothetical protein [Marinobacter zhejiangensis]|uniref:Uncharacterized protein n=1 Tax=Marinobacter zhejiangensis TaxID=488535 RepID=A0A1I4T2I8_9GAMM|nr:hypothetical protein [Marinobacter zhejiangensis]SFM70952.1 hypothetical protein SAMN04487963_3458 [Marinobacter zhejiangensis]
MEELSKSTVTLLGVVVGWLLGQGSELLRSHLKNRKLVGALNAELKDLQAHLEKSMERCAKSINTDDAPRATIWPHAITHPIYTQYYPEICLHITSDQRLSINSIYGHIATFNQRLAGDYAPQAIKRGLFLAYVDAKWAYELIDYYFRHNGKRNLADDEAKIREINADFQGFADKI